MHKNIKSNKISFTFILCICIIFIFLISSCATYYYQEGKTLEQAQQDLGTAYSHFLDSPFLFAKQAKLKGYQELTKDKLPEGTRTQQIDLFGAIYIAGK